MRIIILIIALLGCSKFSIAQQADDSCIFMYSLKPYFLETGDTVISKEKIQKGFTLVLNDTSYKIVRFCMFFNLKSDRFTARFVNHCLDGNSFRANQQFTDAIDKIEGPFFLEWIYAERNGKRYCLRARAYVVK